ncbi:hypothetical protein B2J93_5129 [Marssonina coronariae]|uniref:Uncharacterized protein n=1 Tax=Diplocarpon coronariae TaxID=2795749 RepID=A0A218ZGB8_9HELO|nr:hypothetical protein B2J93_5129 [Marssonina coronariae]
MPFPSGHAMRGFSGALGCGPVCGCRPIFTTVTKVPRLGNVNCSADAKIHPPIQLPATPAANLPRRNPRHRETRTTPPPRPVPSAPTLVPTGKKEIAQARVSYRRRDKQPYCSSKVVKSSERKILPFVRIGAA